MMSLGVSPEVDFMGGGVQGAGSDLMVQGLPDVGQLRVDQQNAGALALPQSVPQSGCQFKTTRTAADNDDRLQRITHVESPLEKKQKLCGLSRYLMFTLIDSSEDPSGW